MTSADFAQLLARGRELRNVEFKAPGPRSSQFLLGKVLRAMLGMANLQDGGLVILGVDEVNNTLVASGISEGDLQTWSHDDLAATMGNYADPAVEFDVESFDFEGKQFLALRVYEFEDVPILCKKAYVLKEDNRDKVVLRQGACYVRNRHKPATTEPPTQAEMRDLLDLATRKGVRRFVQQAQAAGLAVAGPVQPDDASQFRAQAQQIWEGMVH